MNRLFIRSICVFILAALMLCVSACTPAAPAAPVQQSAEAPQSSAAPESTAPVQESEAEAQEAPSTYSANAGSLIGVSLYSRRSQQELDLEAGIREASVKLGFSIIIEDSDTDPSRQVEQINSFVEKGVNAILLDTTDDAAVKDAVAAAQAAGIPVISMIVSATGADAHLGFNYSEDGEAIATWLADYINQNMGGSAKIGVVDFASCKQICQPKLAAFEETLAAACPGAELVAKYDGKGQRSESMTACEKLLMKNPEINFVLVFNEDAAAAAAEIVSDMKRDDVSIIGSAYGDEIFGALASGSSPYIAICSDPYYALGSDAVAIADTLISGVDVAAQTPYPAMLLTPETIAQYDYALVASQRGE